MKIYNNLNSINFGYNNELNDRVNKKLENVQHNKGYAKSLAELNKTINRTEDRLRESIKNDEKVLVKTYVDLLVKVKPTVARKIDEKYPSMNYTNNEIFTYQKELARNKNPKNNFWIEKLVDALQGKQDKSKNHKKEKMDVDLLYDLVDKFEDDLYGIKEKKEDKTDNTPKTEVTATVQEKVAEKKDEPSSFVEKYVPTDENKIMFNDLGGLEDVKEYLKDYVIEPLLNPELAQLDKIEYGKTLPKGILFYGPPGCGKSSTMQAVSNESGLDMYKIKVSKSNSKFINQSSIQVQQGYEYAKKVAKETGKPVLLAIDEMESMTGRRDDGSNHREDDKLVDTILQIMDEAIDNNVMIIGATNFIDKVDDAVEDRFNYVKYIGIPNADVRRQVLKNNLSKLSKGKNLANDDKELEKVVKLTDGFSNRYLVSFVDKASSIARKDGRRDISAQDFIVPVNENIDRKVNESKYKKKDSGKRIGFYG